jgi:hypothetical protein
VTDDRARACLTRLLPHVDRERVALAGGIAIDLHARARGGRRHRAGWPDADIDLVAAAPGVVSPSAGEEFLISHFHLPHPGYPKFLVQLVDPSTCLRVDLFPDALGALARAGVREFAGIAMLVLDPERMLDHKLAMLASASPAAPVDEKHHRDALLLGALCGRAVPPPPAGVCLRAPAYSRDVNAACGRCEASRSDRFPLAPKRRILDILGYV